MAKIFKPRRGRFSTMNGAKKSTILSLGELFLEAPDTGLGTGHHKFKVGDGVTTYDKLPYALGDTSKETIEFSNNTSSTADAALNGVTSGKTLGDILAALKQASNINKTTIASQGTSISNLNTSLSNLNTAVSNLTTTVNTYMPAGSNAIVLKNVASNTVGALWYQ